MGSWELFHLQEHYCFCLETSPIPKIPAPFNDVIVLMARLFAFISISLVILAGTMVKYKMLSL